jgi:hypothetical protein
MGILGTVVRICRRLATPQNHQERNKILAGVRLIGTRLSIQLNA